MMDKSVLDDLTEQLNRLLPQARAAGEDVRQSLDGALRRALSKMDIVTRDEFEQLQQALLRAEQRIEALETALSELEHQANTAAPDADASAPEATGDKPSLPPHETL